MRADRDTFIDQIRQFDTDTLRSLAVSLYDELSRLRMIQLENERISTEAHIRSRKGSQPRWTLWTIRRKNR